jgi:NADH-quinone oxidoreductase subunit H
METVLKILKSVGLENLPYGFLITISSIILAILLFLFIAAFVLFAVWLERKVSAHMQDRLGPMRVGLTGHGELQTIADAIKLLMKEDIIPRRADKILFIIAPYLVFVATFLVFVSIPFGPNTIAADLNVGVFYIIAISSFVMVGIIMAGWSSNNKWSLYGALRSAAQMCSYEIPTALTLIAVVMYVGSLSLQDIIQSQQTGLLGKGGLLGWYFIRNPFLFIAFIIYIISGTAEANRTPFDLPEAESELVAGFHTEYSGMRFAFFFLAEFANMFVIGAVASIVFLGGWHSPITPESVANIPVLRFIFVPSGFWFILKVIVIVFILMWFRWTFPRLRVDQLMATCWKVLIPIAFFNILAIGIWMKLTGIV